MLFSKTSPTIMRIDAIFRVFFSVFLILGVGCTSTTIKPKPPIYNPKVESLDKQILDIVKVDKVLVKGIEIISNSNAAHSELEIKLLSRTDFPKNEENRKKIAKLVALNFKSSLAPDCNYDVYKVVFINIKGNDGFNVQFKNIFSFTAEELSKDYSS